MRILGFAIFVVLTAAAFIIYRFSKKQSDGLRRCICAVCAMMIFSVGLELTLFNINYYKTYDLVETPLSDRLELYKSEDDCYTIPGGTAIEFTDINKELHNIKIDLTEENAGSVNLSLYLTDEANQYYYATPEKTIFNSVEKSEFVNVNAIGKTNALVITFDNEVEAVKLNGISVNSKRDFDFSLIRVLLVLAFLVFVYLFKPSSPLYKKRLSESSNLKNNLIAAFITIQCIIIVVVGTTNPLFLGMDITENGLTFSPLVMEHHNQYDELAQAFMQGKLYIDNDDVPQSLKDMENPYDTVARSETANLTGDDYRWDVAYFDGHYYVYFGIVPLLIMYLPFRLLFNAPFPSAVGIMLFAMVFTYGVFKLLGLLCEKYFKKVSLGTYLLTSLAFVNCCGAMFLVKRPDFYSVPIMTAMAFIIWGIYFWLKGKHTETRKGLYYFIGALFLALSVGCRPQAVLVCAVAIPIFFDYFIKEKQILNKTGIKHLVTLAIPFIVVAAGIMYYNYIRFGSPFDFGSGYNLTTNDVTKRGFDMGRTGLGLFTYLFQPPSFNATFPFIESVNIETNYMGKTIYELCFGGLITSLPILWFMFTLPSARTTLKEKRLLSSVVTLLCIGMAMVIADTQAGGLLQRYFSDFGFIFFLAVSIIIFALSENTDTDKNRLNIKPFLFISTIASLIYTITLVFSVADVTIDTQNPVLYGEILHLVEFWI